MSPELIRFENPKTGRRYLVSYLKRQPYRVTALSGREAVLLVTIEQRLSQFYTFGAAGHRLTLVFLAICLNSRYTAGGPWACRQTDLRLDRGSESEPPPHEFSGGGNEEQRSKERELCMRYEAAFASFTRLEGAEFQSMEVIYGIVKGTVRAALRDFLASNSGVHYNAEKLVRENNYDLSIQSTLYSPD